MSGADFKWLPPTDHKHIEWESVALIGFDASGWPQTITTIEPGNFLSVLKRMALEEINEGIDDDDCEWEEDEELDCYHLEMAEKSLKWALYPVEIAKEIFCSAREERKNAERKHEATEPPKPLPGQLTLPIGE